MAENEISIAEWIKQAPSSEIAKALGLLVGRLSEDLYRQRDAKDDQISSSKNSGLVNAGALAAHLDVPESWVRTEERAGRIPSVRMGKYVRFSIAEVEAKLRSNEATGAMPAAKNSRLKRVDADRAAS